jgi:hypothetical protein
VHAFKPCAWVTYDTSDIKSALALIGSLKALSCSARGNGCLSVAPDRIQDVRHYNAASERWYIDNCIEVTEAGGEGYGARLQFVIYTETPIGTVRVAVRPASVPANWRARNVIERDRYGQIRKAELIEAHRVDAIRHERVKWSAGDGIGASFHVSYYFDGPEELVRLAEDTCESAKRS